MTGPGITRRLTLRLERPPALAEVRPRQAPPLRSSEAGADQSAMHTRGRCSLKTEERTNRRVRATAPGPFGDPAQPFKNECTVIRTAVVLAVLVPVGKSTGGVTPSRDLPALQHRSKGRPPRWPARDLDGEFDPGSGRTLAACLTPASRTRSNQWQHWGRPSGERVSIT